jgi:hypothetical protein
MTTSVEHRVVAGRIRTRAGRPHTVSERLMLIHTCHATPMPRCAVTLRSRFQNGMAVARHGRGMACVNQTRPHCVNQMGRTQSKPLAARRGRETAWKRDVRCELAATCYAGVTIEVCCRSAGTLGTASGQTTTKLYTKSDRVTLCCRVTSV